METVTISLETYENMKKQIQYLTEENKKKEIIKIVHSYEREKIITMVILYAFALGVMALSLII